MAARNFVYSITTSPNAPLGRITAVSLGALTIADLPATGTPSSTTYLRGDGTWATVSGGAGTVTSVNLTAPAAGITVSGGPVTASGSITLALADDLAALEALSGTNTIYYRSGASTWSAVTIGSNLTFSGGTLNAVSSLPSSYLDTDGTLSANSDTRVPSQKAVKTYVDTAVTGLLDLKGPVSCSGNPNYPAALKGDVYLVVSSGRIGGASGKQVDAGDAVIAGLDNAGGDEATVGASWFVVEHNLIGALIAGNNLSDLASASTARTNLGLGALATQSTVTLSGDATGSGAGAVTVTLAASGATAGAYTNPSLNVDAKGRITSISSGAAPVTPTRNVLHNPAFNIWQRGTAVTGFADGSYYADRWYGLSQTSNINMEQGTSGTTNCPFTLKLTQPNATAQRVGIGQVVESADSVQFRNLAAHLRVNVKPSTTTTIWVAILECGLTPNTGVTRDVVLSWTSGTYTPGNFFLSPGYAVVATGSASATGGSFTAITATGTVSNSANNLIVIVWTQNTVAQNVTIDLAECDLHQGSATQTFTAPTWAEDLAMCQRFYLQVGSFPLGFALNVQSLYAGILAFPTTMRATPSLVSGTYAASAGSAGTPALSLTSPHGTTFTNSSNNWTASALIWFSGGFSAEL